MKHPPSGAPGGVEIGDRLEVAENSYKHHFELLDRYQAFSAEVSRLSLAAMAVVGFFLAIDKGAGHDIGARFLQLKVPLTISLLSLSLSVGAALAHRYLSSDVLFYILQSRIRSLTAEERNQERQNLRLSEAMILLAPASLTVGVISVGIAFIMAL